MAFGQSGEKRMFATARAENMVRDDLDTMRERIRERMQALRVSGNEVSRKAGLGLSYVNDLLSGSSKRPAQGNLIRVADALKCDVEYILGEQDAVRAPRDARSISGGAMAPKHATPTPAATRVPLYSSPWPDADGFFQMSAEPDEMTDVPFVGVAGAYAVMVPDDLMAPRYSIGEKVFVNPRRPIVPGCFAVVRLKDGRAIVRRIEELSSEGVVCVTTQSGANRLTIARDEIDTVHRITASSEM